MCAQYAIDMNWSYHTIKGKTPTYKTMYKPKIEFVDNMPHKLDALWRCNCKLTRW